MMLMSCLFLITLISFVNAFHSSPCNAGSCFGLAPNNAWPRTFARPVVPQQLGSFEELDTPDQERHVSVYDWSGGNPIPFREMWDFQKVLVQRHLDGLSVKSSSDKHNDMGLDSIIMLQHEPVYTLGTASDPDFIQQERVDVVRMDRGGEVTYHGPGQLVVYPILDLRRYRQDIHWYMRALEEAVLLALDYAGVRGVRFRVTS